MTRLAVLLLLTALPAWTGSASPPVRFEANAGQFPANIRFAARGASGLLTLDDGGVSFGSRQGMVRLSFPGSHVAAPEGEIGAGVANYLKGSDPSEWHTGVAAYSQVRYRGLYHGIDLVFHATGQEIEYDFAVAPGADPGRIRLRTSGAASVDPEGNLVLGPGLRQHRPVLFQVREGRRLAIAGGYRILAVGLVSFAVGAYDHGLPLVIDPVLSYSTYLGGSSVDRASAVAVDAAGNLYLAGATYSPDLPTNSSSFQKSHGGRPGNEFGLLGPSAVADAFVMKLDPAGKLAYATYLGGSRDDQAYGIAVDAAGNSYVTGTTISDDFPSVSGSFVREIPGLQRVFAVKLSADGSKLLYSARLGGRGFNQGAAAAVDSANRMTICGMTNAADFPTTAGAYRTSAAGQDDAFVARLNASGTALDFGAYFGGSQLDSCSAIAIDAAGAIVLAGTTNSADLPIGPEAPQRALAGDRDGFVARLSEDGSSLLAGTYAGGSGTDLVTSLTLMPDGGAVVAGQTTSNDFPSAPGLHGAADAFVTRFSAGGDRLLFTALLGGSGTQLANGIAADASGNLAICGFTGSPNFPQTADRFAEPYVGSPSLATGGSPFGIPPLIFTNIHAFLTRLNGNTGALLFSTYLGGGGTDSAAAVAVDAAGNAYVAGYSSSFNFPTTLASAQPAFHPQGCTTSGSPSSVNRYACGDAFAVKVAFSAAMTPNPVRIVNTFSGVEGPIAPGEIVNLLGSGIGPGIAEGVELDSQGRVTTVRQNTRVLFDGTAAPIITVSANLITVVVPYDVANHTVSKIVIERGGAAATSLASAVTVAEPALIVFGPGRQVAALNQDGTLNDANHPAKLGSIVTLYVTGMGAFLPPLADGTVVQADSLPKPALPVNVVVGHYTGNILYAGGAPTLVNGVMQLNVQLPSVDEPGQHGNAVPIWVLSGYAVSPATATIAIQ